MSLGRDGVKQFDIAGDAKWLERRALDLTRSRELARDLVQEAFAALLDKPPQIEHSLRAWLDGVMRNHYRMWCRTSQRRHRRELASDEPAGTASPDTALDRARLSEWIMDELDAIAEPYRSTLRMRYFEGLRPAEIARRQRVPQSTVRRRNMVGLKLLRERLSARFGGDGKLLDTALLRAFALALPESAWWATRPRWLPRHGGWGALATTAVTVLLLVSPRAVRPEAADETDPRAAMPATRGRLAPAPTLPRLRLAPYVDTWVRTSPADWDREAVGTTARAGARDRGRGSPSPRLHDGCGSLQALIDEAHPGARLELPACVFREELVIDKPITLVGQPGTELRGSDVFTAWTRHGTLWRSARAIPEAPDTPCTPTSAGDNSNNDICWPFEQVFVDGQPQVLVTGGAPGPGQFALGEGRRILLADDPGRHTVEVTVRPRWLRIFANDVVIRGLTMRHALVGPRADRGALEVDSRTARVRLENNRLLFAAGMAVVVGGQDHQIAGNEIRDNGGTAVSVFPGERVAIIDNHMHGNGRAHRRDVGWVSGGIAVVLNQVVVTRNRILGNEGAGLTCIRCDDARIEGNEILDNTGAGAIFYYTHRGHIAGNRLVRNGFGYEPRYPAMFVTQSHTLHVANNTFAFHDRGIEVNVREWDELPDGFETCGASGQNLVEGNVFVATGAGPVRFTGDPRPSKTVPSCPSNRSLGNRVWYDDEASPEPDLLPLSPADKAAILSTLWGPTGDALTTPQP